MTTKQFPLSASMMTPKPSSVSMRFFLFCDVSVVWWASLLKDRSRRSSYVLFRFVTLTGYCQLRLGNSVLSLRGILDGDGANTSWSVPASGRI